MSLDVYLYAEDGSELFWANITHNLGEMARQAGLYGPLWRPEEMGLSRADEVADAMEAGFIELLRRPTHYRQFNPPNGWGSYDVFLPWLFEYIAALRANPDASVKVSR